MNLVVAMMDGYLDLVLVVRPLCGCESRASEWRLVWPSGRLELQINIVRFHVLLAMKAASLEDDGAEADAPFQSSKDGVGYHREYPSYP